MASEDIVLLKLKETQATLTSNNPILGIGQEVIATGITDAIRDPRKRGDGGSVYTALPFIDTLQIETNTNYDLTQIFLAVNGNEVEITNTHVTDNITITTDASSVIVTSGQTGRFRRIAASWETIVIGLINPRSFTSGRIDSQELISGTLSVDGWYTIAETTGNTGEPCQAEFSTHILGSARQGTFSFRVAVTGGGIARTKNNTSIEIVDRSANGSSFSLIGIIGVRLAKSDSVSNAGFKIQVNVDVSTTLTLLTQIRGNIGGSGQKGFFLVTPYLDDTPTLPDGITAGTFLEAGEEMRMGGQGGAFSLATIQAYKESNDDQLRLSFIWPEIPKRGTGITIIPGNTFRFRGLDGVLSAVIGSFTISNVVIFGKEITCIINQTGISTGMTNTTPAMSLIASEAVITIT
jgi:hypothetical protein